MFHPINPNQNLVKQLRMMNDQELALYINELERHIDTINTPIADIEKSAMNEFQFLSLEHTRNDLKKFASNNNLSPRARLVGAIYNVHFSHKELHRKQLAIAKVIQADRKILHSTSTPSPRKI